jgi:signal transduction histidine kinase/ligand-binding sensor domain-containing protein/DNA-binding response OmpR family regulator
MVRFFKAIIFCFILPLVLYPQSRDIKFEQITTNQGLSQSTIDCILQDRYGFIWFGSGLGLKKFDGYKFISYQHDPDNSHSLSNNEVRSITEDQSGTLWIGTRYGGLNRFDRESEKFIHYRFNKDNRHQKEPIQVLSTLEDQSGKLWIGTAKTGLYLFDPESEIVKRYFHNPENNSGPIANDISVLHEDREGVIWIGTGSGLSRFDRKNELFTHYKHDTREENSLSNNWIWSIAEDISGNVFFGTWNGLNKFDRQKNRFIRYFYEPVKAKVGSKNMMRFMSYAKHSNLLWIATGEGLVIFNPENEEYINFYKDSKRYDNLGNKSITSIYEDRSGIIWVAVFSGEIFKYDPNRLKFIHYDNDPEDPHSLSHGHITALCEDSEGSLWVGTWGGGLNELKVDQVYNPSAKCIIYKHDPFDSRTIASNTVWCIYEDSKKTLWIGTSYGLNKMVRLAGSFGDEKNSDDTHSLIQFVQASKNLRIGCVFEDKYDNLWIGTGRGLYIFDRSTESFTPYSNNPDNIESLDNKDISCIYQSKSGLMWVGTSGDGLYQFDTKTKIFVQFRHDSGNPYSISGNDVYMILEDKSGFLWMTTKNGLNKFDPRTGIFMQYNSNVGLPDDATFALLDDRYGNLWISSGKGIFRYSPQTGKVKSFDVSDGLQSMEFNLWGHKSKRGWMYFAGINGFNAFHPDSINYNDRIPWIVVTDFQIYNRTILPGNNSPLKKTISETETITLTHDQAVFSFEFAALDLHNPQKNLYAYKMDGVDPDWVYTDASRRYATYTNLDPGEYFFRVKGSNNDGQWNEEGRSINIIITPPWWRTNLTYTFYMLLFGSIVFAAWRVQLRRIRFKQQLKMEHFESEKLREVDHLKSRFFANISHEFRTPLTLIKGPVKQILDGEFAGNLKEQCKMILRNSDRLLGLINQILDLSKLESGEIKLQVAETDIIQYLNGMILTFSSLAESKKVTLKFTSTENLLTGYVDCDKLEMIVTNLLSNAFKFTPEAGKVEVTVEIPKSKYPIPDKSQVPNCKLPITNSDFVEITISNTGPGIPADRIDKIFDRFYQEYNNYKKDGEGTGIGLALTKELVEVCRGEISVSSIPNKTTTFVVTLPVTKESFEGDEIVVTPQISPLTKEEFEGVSESIPTPTTNHREFGIDHPASSIEHPVSSILIVEDNPDVTTYISSFMKNDYRIIIAENGKEGLKKALNKYPDLIISDVMMPEMDGFELCQKVKSDERISHIPVILLTAKADLNSKIEGLEFGADDYVTKPFEARELQIRSKNLIEQRRKLREKFSLLIDLKPGDISTSSMDEQLLQRLLSVFEDHMEEPGFSTEYLAREIGMSRMHLNRKIQALTNLSTNEFIRTLRLQRAARLLRSASGTVSEIAYKVGFNNLSYFSKAFRKHFGKLPSDFTEKQ